MKKFWLYPRDKFRQLMTRKNNHFMERLEQQAAILVQGTEALTGYMNKPNKKNTSRVTALEKEADEVRRIMIDELNRTFATPIDREDLFLLSQALDDVLDLAESTMQEMDALRVQPTTGLCVMADMLHKSSLEILLAIQRLENHAGVATQHVVRIKRIENDMAIFYTSELATLFKGEPRNMNDVMTILKLREIYRDMLYAIRGAERVGNIISHVLVKFY